MNNFVYSKLIELGINLENGTKNDWKMKCCFHNENTASCFINKQTGAFFCFGCKIGGNFSKLYYKLTGKQLSLILTFDDVLNKFNSINNDCTKKIPKLHLTRLSKESLLYLQNERHLNLRFLLNNHYKIYNCEENQYSDFIVFPIFNNNKIVSYELKKYRNIDDFKSIKFGNITKYIFNYENIEDKTVIIVESIIDCLYLCQFGFPAITCFGSNISNKQIGKIIDKFENVIIMFDGDVAGALGAKEAKSKLKDYAKVEIVDCLLGLDPDELSAKQLHKLLDKQLEKL